MPLPAETQHPLQSLITALMQLTTSAGSGTAKRYYSFLFRDLPDRREYADYYILITEPRSLNGILVSHSVDWARWALHASGARGELDVTRRSRGRRLGAGQSRAHLDALHAQQDSS